MNSDLVKKVLGYALKNKNYLANEELNDLENSLREFCDLVGGFGVEKSVTSIMGGTISKIASKNKKKFVTTSKKISPEDIEDENNGNNEGNFLNPKVKIDN